MSARFDQFGLESQEISSSFPTPSSSSTSVSASTSTSVSTSAYEFGVDMGIDPSVTMFSAPARHPSIPFVPACARIAEFERLREDLRRTEMIREKQVEMLHALASKAPYEAEVPMFDNSIIPILAQTGYHAPVPEPFQNFGLPTGDPFHLQVNQFDNYQQIYPAPAPVPVPMPPSIAAPMPISYHHYQPQRLPHVPVVSAPSPGFVPRGRVSQACEYCKLRKIKCSGGTPCERCAERAVKCFYGGKKVRGPTKKRNEMRDTPVRQVSSSSATPQPMVVDASAFVPTPVHTRPQPQTLLSAVPTLSRPLFSPPTPATSTLVTASGQVVKPTVSSPPQNEVARPSPPFLQSSHSNSIQPSPSSAKPALPPVKPASPERFSDEEIMMTLKMPTDPSGTPSGFFDFLDPSQEASFPDEPGLYSGRSPNFDSIFGFEADFDSSFQAEVLGEEAIEEARRESETTTPPDVKVKPSMALVPLVSGRAPSMPTIFEEEEEEEEDGDMTITPSAAQKSLLPPDRFARPRSASQLAGAAVGLDDAGGDSLDTPRPSVQTNTSSVPAPDPFDASFSLEAGHGGTQELQSDSFGQSDFFSTLIAGNEYANFDPGASFDFDLSAWDEEVFGESQSQESTPSSSSSFWESTSREEPSTEISVGLGAGIDTGTQFLFPSVDMETIGNWNGWPGEDEFLRAVMQATQSTPKREPVQYRFESFLSEVDFDP